MQRASRTIRGTSPGPDARRAAAVPVRLPAARCTVVGRIARHLPRWRRCTRATGRSPRNAGRVRLRCRRRWITARNSRMERRSPRAIFVSGNTGAYAYEHAGDQIVELLVRPPGWGSRNRDPPVGTQLDDLPVGDQPAHGHGRSRAGDDVTKRMAENLPTTCPSTSVKVRYLHSVSRRSSA